MLVKSTTKRLWIVEKVITQHLAKAEQSARQAVSIMDFLPLRDKPRKKAPRHSSAELSALIIFRPRCMAVNTRSSAVFSRRLRQSTLYLPVCAPLDPPPPGSFHSVAGEEKEYIERGGNQAGARSRLNGAAARSSGGGGGRKRSPSEIKSGGSGPFNYSIVSLFVTNAGLGSRALVFSHGCAGGTFFAPGRLIARHWSSICRIVFRSYCGCVRYGHGLVFGRIWS